MIRAAEHMMSHSQIHHNPDLLGIQAGEIQGGGVTGDAGDELFGGYDRYVWVEKIWKLLRWCPPAIRAPVGGIWAPCPAVS